MDQNPKKGLLKCHWLFSVHQPFFSQTFFEWKNSAPRRDGALFRQEKYLQQIQAAILERDAEAPRVDSIRVTGKMARAWRLGADQLFVFFFLHDIEITVPQGDFCTIHFYKDVFHRGYRLHIVSPLCGEEACLVNLLCMEPGIVLDGNPRRKFGVWPQRISSESFHVYRFTFRWWENASKMTWQKFKLLRVFVGGSSWLMETFHVFLNGGRPA